MVTAAPSASPSHSPSAKPTLRPSYAPTNAEYELHSLCIDPHLVWAGLALAFALVLGLVTVAMWYKLWRSRDWLHDFKVWVYVGLTLCLHPVLVVLSVIPRAPSNEDAPCVGLAPVANLATGRKSANVALSAVILGTVFTISSLITIIIYIWPRGAVSKTFKQEGKVAKAKARQQLVEEEAEED